ncbi:hypothetical protein RvY_01221 [Ramazzottius varieornatus]|uniref:PPM-type phosphatase domain-containing protein n=1 Tax=Ramazzottius varieornatus TaxID=947166 RepID=A0A1D1UQV8_RAMVA|nr:hypothetical protein RvY_01221 [Ramazzottius varieornatus]
MSSYFLTRAYPYLSYQIRSFHLQVTGGVKTKLTPQQINHVLRLREASSAEVELPPPIKSYEVSQLAANFPIEDRCIEAQLLRAGGMLFSVIDGHGGPACGQAISERLADYVSVALMDKDGLDRIAREMDASAQSNFQLPQLVSRRLHPGDYLVSGQRTVHLKWLKNYVIDRLNSKDDSSDISQKLKDAFVRLDNDLSSCGLESLDENDQATEQNNLENLASSLSGAVVCAAYVDDCDLYVASTGDCSAFIASRDDEDIWTTKSLAAQHTHENKSEMERILKDHPGEEATVVTAERLLGQLYPLRAFGDCQYKWPVAKLKAILKNYQLMHLFPNGYATPPYLTAEPDVVHHRLIGHNKFMMLSSDGLFDFLDERSAGELVIEHMSGRRALQPFVVTPHSTLAELNVRLKKRSVAQSKKPDDSNVATHVIRHALGSTVEGLDVKKLSQALSASVEEARYQRDDMTVQVVFFDTDYLRMFSPMESSGKKS